MFNFWESKRFALFSVFMFLTPEAFKGNFKYPKMESLACNCNTTLSFAVAKYMEAVKEVLNLFSKCSMKFDLEQGLVAKMKADIEFNFVNKNLLVHFNILPFEEKGLYSSWAFLALALLPTANATFGLPLLGKNKYLSSEKKLMSLIHFFH